MVGLSVVQSSSSSPFFSFSFSFKPSFLRSSIDGDGDGVAGALSPLTPRRMKTPPPPPLARRICIVASFVVVFLLSSLPSGRPDLASDAAALLAFRTAVGRAALDWNSTAPPCTWHGVSCDSGRVAELRLPGAGLMGQIPAGALGNLTELRTLSLRFNALAGTLPPDLAGCSQIRGLYLQGNRFSGEIPAFLFSLRNLVRLNLARNNFSGEIPPGFNDLTRLGTLYLEENRLSGEIPDLDKLPDLVQFNVSMNRLTGSIPAGLRRMPPSAFDGMSLCGGPLPACPGEITPPAETAPPTEAARKRKQLSGGAIAGIAVGSVAAGLILLCLVSMLCRSKSKARPVGEVAPKPPPPPEMEAAFREKGVSGGEIGNGVAPQAAIAPAAPASVAAVNGGSGKLVFIGDRPRVFGLEELLRASAEVLGKGVFGTSYKAVLDHGMVVAVKRLKDVNLEEAEFVEKIESVGAMDHPSLVALRAYYFSKEEKLLVYDYMPMGSLSALLHGNRGSGRSPLDWETRLDIALSAARGIEYIHSTAGISHGNIKSSNILLAKLPDDARVSDHGLANLVGPSLIPSSRVAAGYRAPEVTDTSKVSQKADVYSFGVLILELLTGKAPVHALLNEEEEGVDLPRWVQSVVREEWTSEVFDMELLRYQNVEEDMVELLQLAVDCSAHHPDRRPSMPEVATRIQDIRRRSSGAGLRNPGASGGVGVDGEEDDA